MSALSKLKNFLLRRSNPMQRVDGAFGRLQTEAGLSPLYKDRTVEIRRKEIIDVMQDLNELEFEIVKEKTEKGETFSVLQKVKEHNFKAFKLAKLFQLFFVTGDPWIRGLDNGKLSIAVSALIEQYEDVGHLTGFLNMLTSEAYELIHLAWQTIDVDVMPPMLLSSQPLLINQPNTARPRYMTPETREAAGAQQE
jgi:hypothetical protein